MELNPTLLSKSAITYINANYCKDFEYAYLLAKEIAAQYKHPIILDYKHNLTNIRLAMGLTDKYFRQTLNNAVRFNLATIEGKHLRLISKTQDRIHFKQSKKNDYRSTHKTKAFRELVLMQYFTYSQVASITEKQKQPEFRVQSSAYVDQLLNYDNESVNYNITASCRAVQKLLKLSSPTQAKKVLDRLHASGLITLKKNRTPITPHEAVGLIKKGMRKNVRFDVNKQQHYVVTASEIKLNYTLRRIKPSKWDMMSEREQMTAKQLGYTKEYINSL